jgi:pimeloyl-ACP methyl ester carboxylesterase
MRWFPWGEQTDPDGLLPPVLFLPGWGFSGRLLPAAEHVSPWWAPEDLLDPETVVAEIDSFLQRRQWPGVILVGWSLGALFALRYAALNPARIDHLVLLSMRRIWPVEEIRAISEGFTADPARFMENFYRKCFLGHKRTWRHFSAAHLPIAFPMGDRQRLLAGLDYLEAPPQPFLASLRQSGLPPDKVWLVHGGRDVIAPLEERVTVDGANHIEYQKEGHALFLNPEVRSLSFLAE